MLTEIAKDICFFKALILFTLFKKFKPALRNALKALQFDPNNPLTFHNRSLQSRARRNIRSFKMV